MHFTASLGVGLLLGVINWALWSRWGKSLLETKRLHWGLFFFRSFIKIGFLGAVLWFLLTRHFVDPIGLLIGFSINIVFLIFKGLKWH